MKTFLHSELICLIGSLIIVYALLGRQVSTSWSKIRPAKTRDENLEKLDFIEVENYQIKDLPLPKFVPSDNRLRC